MKSDIIRVNNRANNINRALEETLLTAQYRKLNSKETLQLDLCVEEMFSMFRSITGDIEGDFWIESEGKAYQIHLSTEASVNREQRAQLISASSFRKNEAAKTFLGALRDAFEELIASSGGPEEEIPDDIGDDLFNREIELTEWDRYEVSILQKIADQIRISIRSKKIEMIVSKSFA